MKIIKYAIFFRHESFGIWRLGRDQWLVSFLGFIRSSPRKLSASSATKSNMTKNPIKYYVVDSFADTAFKGNPAAVCLLVQDTDQKWLQAVANEFNLSATCFLTRIPDSATTTVDSNNLTPNHRFRLRWFSPVTELKLCGHGTLAAAHVLCALVKSNVIEFVTQSGTVSAKRVLENGIADALNSQKSEGIMQCSSIELDFPLVPIVEFNSGDASQISQALGGASIIEIKRTTTKDDLLVILPSSKAVEEAQPDFDALKQCPGRGIIISGVAPPESGYDFYSRFFCPKYGINEDPVTGSAQCALANYWNQRLRKHAFVAYVASQRGGVVNIHLDEQSQRVLLRGNAFTVMEGCLQI